MARRQIPALIDYWNLQRFGKCDQPLHAGVGARDPAGHNDRIFRRDQQLGRFDHRTGIALRMRIEGELRNAQTGSLGAAFSCRSLSITRTTGSIGSVMEIL